MAINDHVRWQAMGNWVHREYQIQMRPLNCSIPAGRLQLDFITIYVSPIYYKTHRPVYKW